MALKDAGVPYNAIEAAVSVSHHHTVCVCMFVCLCVSVHVCVCPYETSPSQNFHGL